MKITELQLKIINLLGRNISQSEIANALELDKSSISQRIKRGKDLTHDEILKLENYFKLSLQNSTILNDELVYLPVNGEVSVSLGNGKEVFSEAITEKLSFPKSLFKKIHASPSHCCIVNTDGESMKPTIIGGQDMVMVDRSQIEVFDGKIYLIRIENSLFVKRLQKLPKGQLKVISDNPEYDSYIIDLKDETLNFAVLGRIVWISRPL